MSPAREINLGLGLLDHQLLDSEGRQCGKVDDVELEGGVGGKLEVKALLVGGTAWRGRGRLGRLTAKLSGNPLVRVGWDEVERVESGIELRKTAKELRLGRGDDSFRGLFEKLPGGS
jgi:sporulation protein YlmC with PRC-barrel domain